MQKPNVEHMMYDQLELMSAMMQGMEKNYTQTKLNNSDIGELLKGLCVGMFALRVEFDRVFDEANQPKSVCS